MYRLQTGFSNAGSPARSGVRNPKRRNPGAQWFEQTTEVDRLSLGSIDWDTRLSAAFSPLTGRDHLTEPLEMRLSGASPAVRQAQAGYASPSFANRWKKLRPTKPAWLPDIAHQNPATFDNVFNWRGFILVRPERLELPTCWFEVIKRRFKTDCYLLILTG
jgi:hypothetical protein